MVKNANNNAIPSTGTLITADVGIKPSPTDKPQSLLAKTIVFIIVIRNEGISLLNHKFFLLSNFTLMISKVTLLWVRLTEFNIKQASKKTRINNFSAFTIIFSSLRKHKKKLIAVLQQSMVWWFDYKSVFWKRYHSIARSVTR